MLKIIWQIGICFVLFIGRDYSSNWHILKTILCIMFCFPLLQAICLDSGIESMAVVIVPLVDFHSVATISIPSHSSSSSPMSRIRFNLTSFVSVARQAARDNIIHPTITTERILPERINSYKPPVPSSSTIFRDFEVTMWKSILMFICILPLLSLYFSSLAPCKVPSSLLSTELMLCQVRRNLLHRLQVKLVIYHNIIQLHMSETTLRVGRSS